MQVREVQKELTDQKKQLAAAEEASQIEGFRASGFQSLGLRV